MTKRISTILLIFSIVLQLSQCNVPDSRSEEIDELFSRWNNTYSPGCAVLVYQDGKVLYNKAFGMANIQDSIAIQSTTQFHIASITKQFTGMAIAILENRNLIDKDDEIKQFIPELPVYGKSIRIKHLLNHTSGIPEYQYIEELAGINGRNGIEQEVFFELLRSRTNLNNDPGERYIYSNSNYILLAMIVEKVTGLSFPDFVEKEIFKPLKLDNSKFITEIKEQKRIAHGYNQDYKIEEPSISSNAIIGHSGLVSNLEDLGIWAEGLLSNKIPASESLMRRPDTGHYNYGLQYFHHYGRPTISHGGVHYGFRSNILIFPTESFYVIILGNIDDEDFFYNNYAIADIFLQDSYEKINVEKAAKFDLDQFTGKFTNSYMDEVVQISCSDSTLNIRNYQKGENSVAFPKDENLFVSSNSSGQKIFRFDQKDGLLEITNNDGSRELFNRAEEFYPAKKELEKLTGSYTLENTGLVLNLIIDESGNISSDLNSEYFNGYRPMTSGIWMNENIPMMTMRFQQKNGEIQGLTLSLDRLKDLEFERLNR